jgi:hypothetical protein
MRKLIMFCCFIAAITFLIFACQKNDDFESNLPNSEQLLGDTPSVSESKQVQTLTSQNGDYPHFTSHKSLDIAVQKPTEPTSLSRFALTYFSDLEGEKEKIYTSKAFKNALIEAGLSEKEAQNRTNRIFESMNCSPAFMTETAQLLSPTLPSHTEGVFICELFKPYDYAKVDALIERTTKNDGTSILLKKAGANPCVKSVNRLSGVCGSIAAVGGNKIELFLTDIDNNVPIGHSFNYQDVRLILQESHGYTEGEAVYLKLILGELTEQEVWLLFEKEICPELQKKDRSMARSQIVRLVFRYNYVEIMGNTGRLGYTIYDLDGFVADKIVL